MVEFQGRSDYARACHQYIDDEREWSDLLLESQIHHWIDWSADVAGKPMCPDLLRKVAETLYDELPREVLDVLEQGKQPPLGAGLMWMRGLVSIPSPALASELESELDLDALRTARLKKLEACGAV